MRIPEFTVKLMDTLYKVKDICKTVIFALNKIVEDIGEILKSIREYLVNIGLPKDK